MGEVGKEFWKVITTAHHIAGNLAKELYLNTSACLWEAVRNGVCAYMPSTKWLTGVGKVEIFLEKDFPLAPKTTSLVVLDHGRGFTSADVKRFCAIGPRQDDLRESPEGTHGGAAQKRIGRFAYLGLNQKCRGGDLNTGFYILTRTSEFGEIRLVSVILAEFEARQEFLVRQLDPHSDELGSLKGKSGSFTAVIIPHTVFSSYTEIRRALEWYLPRKRDLTFKLMVGGEQLLPPPLADALTLPSPDGTIDMHIGVCGEDEVSNGLWFTDATTGLRVARADASLVPIPYCLPQFFGDIFVPNLLKNQGTARSGMKEEYLKSQAWTKVLRYLGTQAEKLRAKLGEEERFGESPVKEAVSEFIALCRKAWGIPELSGGTLFETKTQSPGHGPKGNEKIGRHGGRHAGAEKKLRKRPGDAFRIGERTFVFLPQGLKAITFVELQSDGQTLYLNERGYRLLPPRKEARNEHIMNAILFAVATGEFPGDSRRAQERAAEYRLELLGENKQK